MTATAITSIDAQVVVPSSSHRATRARCELDALDWARAEVGPNQTQVSLTAHTDDPAHTFAVRHLVWNTDGTVRDTGWRLWRDDTFVGGGNLGELIDTCEATDATECALIRERDAAGTDETIAACHEHGAHPDETAR